MRGGHDSRIVRGGGGGGVGKVHKKIILIPNRVFGATK